MLFDRLTEIYERFDHPVESVFGFPIAFDPTWRRVAVSVSGGADSALLCFILANLATTHQLEKFDIHVINHIRCWKTKPWQQYDADRVIQWLVIKFPNIHFVRHTNFIPPELEWSDQGPIIGDQSGDIIEIQSFAEYVCIKNEIDAYFNAVTRNPKEPLDKAMSKRDVDPNGSNDHLQITNYLGKIAVHPFRFVDKSVIMKLYRQFNILDLFRVTRSCEGEFVHINYKTYTPGQYMPICGKCFWCLEREWAVEHRE